MYDYTPDELQKLANSSNSYSDILRKIGMKETGGNYATLKKVIDKNNIDTSILFENRKNLYKNMMKNVQNNRKKIEEIFVENSTYNNGSLIKRRLLDAKLKSYKCEHCNLKEWQGQPIPLQVHHKNGKHDDNRIDNLELLCPNCHALTDNYAGKNINRRELTDKIQKQKSSIKEIYSENGQRLYDEYGKYKILCPNCNKKFMTKSAKMCSICYKKERRKPPIAKDELFKIMETNSYHSAADLLGVDESTVSRWHKYYVNKKNDNNSEIRVIGSDKSPSRDVLKTKIRAMSFVQIGKEYGVTDNSVRRWCDAYKLPRLKRDINAYSDEEWEVL